MKKHKHIFNWHESSTTRWEECRLCDMKKKPELPSKITSRDTDSKQNIERLAWYINELIDYIKYLEERIFKLERGD